MAGVLKFCKVLSLPETLIPDAVYMVKDGDSVVIYVTDDYSTAYPFKPGASAYEAAVSLGFEGTEAEWIASLEGADGLSAYQVAVDNGFVGTEAEWLQSLEYDPGYTPQDSAKRETDGTLASNSDDFFPSTKAARTFIASAISDANSFASAAANEAEAAAKNYADALVASALKLCGGHDASGNTYPATGGSGTGGAIKAGNLWFVSVPGTIGGKPVVVGDALFAVEDNPGQTSAKWCVLDTNLGFVPEEAGTASAAIAAHLIAIDPHGDRSYADGIVAALSATVESRAVTAALSAMVAYDRAQSLTTEQKTQAIANLGFTFPEIQQSDFRKAARPWFDDFDFMGDSTSDYANNTRTNSNAMTITSPANGSASKALLGAYPDSCGWLNFYSNSISPGIASYSYVDPMLYNYVAADVVKEYVAALIFRVLPTNTTTTDAVYRYGLYNPLAVVANPFAASSGDGNAYSAFFSVDKDGFWKCSSGHNATGVEHTTTAVAAVADTRYRLRIIIASSGVVTFYINGAVVATHATGLCNTQQSWAIAYQVYNQGSGVLSASASGRGSTLFDYWGAKFVFPTQRPDALFLS